MADKQVDKRVTRWTVQDLLEAYDRAFSACKLGDAQAGALATLAAQSTLECGRGGPGCYNYNVSNIMGSSPAGLYHVLQSPECAPSDKVPAGALRVTTSIACPPGMVAYVPAGGSRFRAYLSLDDGCVDKIATLGKTWPRALEVLVAGGDVDTVSSKYVAELRRPAYFTGDPATYLSVVRSVAREYLSVAEHVATCRGQDAPPASTDGHEPLGSDVVSYQKALIALGYDLGRAGADGISGVKTITAVRAFQTKAGLTVDGIVGKKTLAALDAALKEKNRPC